MRKSWELDQKAGDSASSTGPNTNLWHPWGCVRLSSLSLLSTVRPLPVMLSQL